MRKNPNYWTFDRCFEDASKCQNMREWRKRYPLSYNKVKGRAPQWLEKLTAHFDGPPEWTKEECLMSLKEYSSLSRWRKKNWSMSVYAERRGWIPFLLKKSGIEVIRPWTDERIRAEIKGFKTLNEWRKKSPNSYGSVMKRGIVHKFGLKNKSRPTKREIFAECLKYNQIQDWKYKSHQTYGEAIKLGILSQCRQKMGIKERIPQSYWNFDRCKVEALKFKSRSQWINESQGSYSAATKNGWIENVTKHMLSTTELINIKRLKWTKDKCKMSAREYTQISHWKKENPGAYSSARSNGWLKECTSHMKVILGYWTKERCIEDAKKYTRKGKWHKESAGAFRAALNNGWFKECTSHMHQWRTKQDCLKDALKFKTKEEWFIQSPGFYWSAYSRGYFKYCTKHMPERSVGQIREKKSVDKLIKYIKNKFNNRVKIDREIMLDRKSFPDLILSIGEKRIILEVKHDSSHWKKKHLDSQLEKYKISGKKKYKKNFIGCYICSPLGKYGKSFSEVLALVKESILIQDF